MILNNMCGTKNKGFLAKTPCKHKLTNKEPPVCKQIKNFRK